MAEKFLIWRFEGGSAAFAAFAAFDAFAADFKVQTDAATKDKHLNERDLFSKKTKYISIILRKQDKTLLNIII